MEDGTVLARYCQETLSDLPGTRLGQEYYYSALPLCVVDAVFSIQARYKTTQRTVLNWCQAQTPQWEVYRPFGSDSPHDDATHSITEFALLLEKWDYEALAKVVFRNSQRTSSRFGILKAEAVSRFAKALASAGIEHFGDVQDDHRLLEARLSIQSIPGQRSGITFDYFLMLAGSENLVKSDSMVIRFVSRALDRSVQPKEAARLVRTAAEGLRTRLPRLTPRLLDYAIWSYQRQIDLPHKPVRAPAGP